MISILQLGSVDYATGLRLQEKLVALRKAEKIGDVLLLLEHSPVITLGRNAKSSNVIASPEFLRQRGVEIFESDRGGDVTFHGPGQIVGYPIFDLRGFANSHPSSSRANRSETDGDSRDPVFSRKHLGAVDFVRRLEEVLIRTCADFRIPAKRICGLTGVWTAFQPGKARVGADAFVRPVEQSSTAAADSTTETCDNYDAEARDFTGLATVCSKEAASATDGADSKLAAIGVHISRFVTSHGFALNVNTDLSYFNLIVPCGITTKPVTSMQKELGRALDLNAAAESISRNFGVVFQSQILWLESLDTLLCGADTPVRAQP